MFVIEAQQYSVGCFGDHWKVANASGQFDYPKGLVFRPTGATKRLRKLNCSRTHHGTRENMRRAAVATSIVTSSRNTR
jgi:hypothetical protein